MSPGGQSRALGRGGSFYRQESELPVTDHDLKQVLKDQPTSFPREDEAEAPSLAISSHALPKLLFFRRMWVFVA